MLENNGMTTKEMIMLVIQGQREINQRIDELHEKTNSKVSKTEFFVVQLSSLEWLRARI